MIIRLSSRTHSLARPSQSVVPPCCLRALHNLDNNGMAEGSMKGGSVESREFSKLTECTCTDIQSMGTRYRRVIKRGLPDSVSIDDRDY
jgi:hypothetical protein